MKVVVLGTGTSTGVPVAGCSCRVCASPNERNKRLRTSVYLEAGSARILIDSSVDLRQQALRAGITGIDAVLYTHPHADHILGVDDLRAFNFVMQKDIPVFADAPTARVLQDMFRYAFFPNPSYVGGTPPKLTLSLLEPYVPLEIGGQEILPLSLKHGALDILGYRIGNFAYLTDCSALPERTRDLLAGTEVLIIDGLRARPHPTHFTQLQAAEEAVKLGVKRAYLTHISHDVDHDEGNEALREIGRGAVELAYDGLTLDL